MGADVVTRWASELPEGARVLDIGAGTGFPVTEALAAAGLDAHAIDASPRMVDRFRERLPGVPIACEDVRTSVLFGLRFEGIVAVGLIFLLTDRDQADLIARLSAALVPGGRLLLSAPHETGQWEDVLTGLPSRSLGEATYRELLRQAGFGWIDSLTDSGGNHHYSAVLGP